MKPLSVTLPRPRPIICGCAGLTLTADERDFFTGLQPFGFILMGRNCQAPEQIRALTGELRSCLAHADAPVLIDQEGGRVARLRPPLWPAYPPAALMGALYAHDAGRGLELARLVGNSIGALLHALGITVNCAPVLDIAHSETHEAIGDRAFSADPAAVAVLGDAYAQGLLQQHVLPVVKHLPGHGYAAVDPHLSLPVVTQPREAIAADFAPFRMLAHLPLGMTSHILFRALDPDCPASQSRVVVQRIIRGEIGFKGLLMSDDLDMKALGETLRLRAEKVLAAGTDALLICNAGIDALAELAHLPSMSEEGWERWQKAQNAFPRGGREPITAAHDDRIAHLREMAKNISMIC